MHWYSAHSVLGIVGSLRVWLCDRNDWSVNACSFKWMAAIKPGEEEEEEVNADATHNAKMNINHSIHDIWKVFLTNDSIAEVLNVDALWDSVFVFKELNCSLWVYDNNFFSLIISNSQILQMPKEIVKCWKYAKQNRWTFHSEQYNSFMFSNWSNQCFLFFLFLEIESGC